MPFRPTDDDENLWNFVTHGAKKFLNNHTSKKKQKKLILDQKADVAIDAKYVMPSTLEHKTAKSQQAPQLNRRDAERLRKGQVTIDATIDLHGMTQEQARQSLDLFMMNSISRKYRCVLIITGKGKLSKPSVLKQKLPEWLELGPYAGYILKLTTAHPRHGGSGAFYAYLKRT